MSDSSIPTAVPRAGATVRLARFALDHRRLVVLLWILLLPAGIYGASHVSNRLKVDFSLPGQPGYETAKKIQQTSMATAAASRRSCWCTRPPAADVEADAPTGERVHRAARTRSRAADRRCRSTGDPRVLHQRTAAPPSRWCSRRQGKGCSSSPQVLKKFGSATAPYLRRASVGLLGCRSWPQD